MSKRTRKDSRGRLRTYHAQGYEERDIPPRWYERIIESAAWGTVNAIVGLGSLWDRLRGRKGGL